MFSLNKNGGLSLIDVIVGASLMLVVFLGVFGVFKLSIDIVAINKAKTEAISLAKERLEYIRSLSYGDIGTVGGIPQGGLVQEENITINESNYTRRTFIKFHDDPKDGEGVGDENGIDSDYKKVKVEIIWEFKGDENSLSFVTNIVPPDIETEGGGGTLSINVLDASASPVQGAEVSILNSDIVPEVSLSATTNDEGKIYFPGTPASDGYEIEVSKSGYSNARTYDETAENVDPDPGHLRVIEGERTPASFFIDEICSKTILTFEEAGDGNLFDTFQNSGKIASSSNVEVYDLGASDEVRLYESVSGFEDSGFLYSSFVEPEYLNYWSEFSWQDETSTSTSIYFKVYTETATGTQFLSEGNLPGNSSGFTESPVDLSSLSVQEYPNLGMYAYLETNDASTTPAIYEWSIGYNAGPTPIENIPFSMVGDKVIGEDSEGNPIYKYDGYHTTDSEGEFLVEELEWGSYTISIDSTLTGYDIKEACEPQPRYIEPGSDVTTNIILAPHTDNSILISVFSVSGELLEEASVRLYNSSFGYDEEEKTSECGQVFFRDLSAGSTEGENSYSIDVSASGFESETLDDVDVEGSSKESVILDKI